jgi:hypothetical protein
MADDELDDRLSARFGDSQDEDEPSPPSQEDTDSSPSQKAQTSQKVQNIKKEWNVRSFYLNDEIDSRLTTAYKRLDLELSESSADVDLKKTRHFYPLLVELGLERLDDLDIDEVESLLQQEE